MPTLYILIVDEPGKEQFMKIFLTERDAAFFLAQFNEWHLHAKCHCYTVEGKLLAFHGVAMALACKCHSLN